MLQAFASFAAAVAVQPLHAHALVACAAIYRSSGQLDNAVSALETAAAAAPADAAVQQAYAAGLNAVGKVLPWQSSILSGVANIVQGWTTLALRSMASPLLQSPWMAAKPLCLQLHSSSQLGSGRQHSSSISKLWKSAQCMQMDFMTWGCTTVKIARSAGLPH